MTEAPPPSRGALEAPDGDHALLLASASPRRAELLGVLGIPFRVHPLDLDEKVLPGEEAEAHVQRLASEKAGLVSRRHPGEMVLGGDTVVVLDGEILGKPADASEARAMLRSLAGRPHLVSSGLALARAGGVVGAGVETTRVIFRELTDEEIHGYVDTGEPMDKAGSYGIQGRGAALVRRVEGDYTAVVGLPVSLLLRLLAAAGRPYRFPPAGADTPPLPLLPRLP